MVLKAGASARRKLGDNALSQLRPNYEAALTEYTRILEECLQHIPEQMVVHRITGDGAKKDLLAPLWSGNKKAVLNYINSRLDQDGIRQGSHFVP